MIKVLDSGVMDPKVIAQRTQVLHDFGAFLTMWGEFELALELAIARRAKLSAINASIILGGLQFGAKSSILLSLLSQQGADPAIAKAVSVVIETAKRNALVHGYANFEGGEEVTFVFSKREVKSSYKVTHAEFTSDGFHKHLLELQRLMGDAFSALRITSADVSEYGETAQLLAPVSQHPQSPRQHGRTGSE
jgi:hypothetical protein